MLRTSKQRIMERAIPILPRGGGRWRAAKVVIWAILQKGLFYRVFDKVVKVFLVVKVLKYTPAGHQAKRGTQRYPKRGW